jgi:hypothetical protein
VFSFLLCIFFYNKLLGLNKSLLSQFSLSLTLYIELEQIYEKVSEYNQKNVETINKIKEEQRQKILQAAAAKWREVSLLLPFSLSLS